MKKETFLIIIVSIILLWIISVSFYLYNGNFIISNWNDTIRANYLFAINVIIITSIILIALNYYFIITDERIKSLKRKISDLHEEINDIISKYSL